MDALKSHCRDLAEYVLAEQNGHTGDMPVHRVRVIHLTLVIQQAVEDWCVENPDPTTTQGEHPA